MFLFCSWMSQREIGIAEADERMGRLGPSDDLLFWRVRAAVLTDEKFIIKDQTALMFLEMEFLFILGGARVTERIMPGALSQDHGARHDPIAPGLDRGGSNNMISPHGLISRNCLGVATSGFLVDVEKVDLEKLRNEYPEAFEREYDTASGLLFSSWVVKG